MKRPRLRGVAEILGAMILISLVVAIGITLSYYTYGWLKSFRNSVVPAEAVDLRSRLTGSVIYFNQTATGFTLAVSLQSTVPNITVGILPVDRTYRPLECSVLVYRGSPIAVPTEKPMNLTVTYYDVKVFAYGKYYRLADIIPGITIYDRLTYYVVQLPAILYISCPVKPAYILIGAIIDNRFYEASAIPVG